MSGRRGIAEVLTRLAYVLCGLLARLFGGPLLLSTDEIVVERKLPPRAKEGQWEWFSLANRWQYHTCECLGTARVAWLW